MWSYPTNSSELRTAFFITKLISTVPDSNVKMCRLCEKQYTDIFVHVCYNCQYSVEIQIIWWDLIIENFCLELYVELSSYEDEVLYTKFYLEKLRVPI
jgi:hypothetical protein